MKVRIGFVSNSSSASFVLPRAQITDEQWEKLRDHQRVGEELGIPYAATDWWTLNVEDGINIFGHTPMTNFDMLKFMVLIGIDVDKIRWTG